MSKEHKEIKISFDFDGSNLSNIKLDGSEVELATALAVGGETMNNSALNAALMIYLRQNSREKFLSYFLSTAAKYDEDILKKIQNSKVQS